MVGKILGDVVDSVLGCGIILKNAVPESARKGLEEDVCTFKVQNTGSVSGEYTVYLDDEELEEKEKRM